MAATEALQTPLVVPSVTGANPVYAECVLRINHPARSQKFYADLLRMKLLTRFDFPAFKFSLFFYSYSDAVPPSMGTPQPERANWLRARPETTLELTWNWTAGTFGESMAQIEDDSATVDEVYVNGNEDPKGFGFVEFGVSDVSAAVAALKSADARVICDVTAKSSSDVASATVADPDSYHVRLVGPAASGQRDAPVKNLQPYFSSVMLRVRDASTALPIFNRLGSTLAKRDDNDEQRTTDYSLSYSAARGDGDTVLPSTSRKRKLTLHHEWGSESLAYQPYTNGNTKPHRGFGHIGIIVDDPYAIMDQLEKYGYKVVRKASPFADMGKMFIHC